MGMRETLGRLLLPPQPQPKPKKKRITYYVNIDVCVFKAFKDLETAKRYSEKHNNANIYTRTTGDNIYRLLKQ